MSNFTLGRIGFDVDIDDVAQWDMQGSQVNVSWSIPWGDQAYANGMRQQLLGYVDSPDEEYVAVTWVDDPSVDGYYRVLSADVTPDPDLALDGLYYFHATLQRVSGYTTPILETTHLIAERPSEARLDGQADPVAVAAVPAAAEDVLVIDPVANEAFWPDAPVVQRTGEGGAVVNIYTLTYGSLWPPTDPIRCTQMQLPAASYYTLAATLRIGGHVVVGRQAANLPRDFEISNGLVRVSVVDIDSVFKLSVENWRNSVSAWSASMVGKLRFGTSTSRTDVFEPHSITVLENNPEKVAVRLFAKRTGSMQIPLVVDLTVRRGASSVYVRFHSPTINQDAYPSIEFEGSIFHTQPTSGRYMFGYMRPGGTNTRINRASNPRCGLEATGWHAYVGTDTGRQLGSVGAGPFPWVRTWFRGTATAAHADTAFGAYGGHAGQNPISASTQYTYSIYARTSSSRACQIKLIYRDAGGAQVGSTVLADARGTNNVTWTRFNVTNTSPVGAVRVEVGVVGQGGAAWANGQTIDVTGMLIEAGATLNAYFDGWSTAENGNAAVFEGAEHDSMSYLYTTSETDGQFVMSTFRVGKSGSEIFPEASSGGSQENDTWDFAFGRMIAGSWEFEGETYMVTPNIRESLAAR